MNSYHHLPATLIDAHVRTSILLAGHTVPPPVSVTARAADDQSRIGGDGVERDAATVGERRTGHFLLGGRRHSRRFELPGVRPQEPAPGTAAQPPIRSACTLVRLAQS
jgi:hypothetical protein